MGLNMRNLPLRRNTKRTWGLVLFMTVYVVAGAAVFYVLENPGEILEREELQQRRSAFLRSYPCVKGMLHPSGDI